MVNTLVKDRKGFTLIELIVTIALLAVVSVISVVSVNYVITESKVADCDALLKNIEIATKNYISDNRYSDINGNSIIITAEDLINDEYLSSPLVNPFTDNEINPKKIRIDVGLKKDYSVDSVKITTPSKNDLVCDTKSSFDEVEKNPNYEEDDYEDEPVDTKEVAIPTSNKYCKEGVEYTGNTVFFVNENENSEYYTLENTSGLNPGDYTVIASLTSDDYKWADGSKEDKTFKCSISKRKVIISAKAQTITYGDSIATGVSQIVAEGLVDGHKITDVSLNTEKEINNAGGPYNINVSDGVIKNGNTDVTGKYEIKYEVGSLTVNKQKVNAPTNVSVSTAGIVTWTDSSNATDYEISIDGSTWKRATNGINYLDTIIASTGDRTVYVRAVNKDTANYSTSNNAMKSVTVNAVTFTTNTVNGKTPGTLDASSYNVISGVTVSTSSNKLTINGITSGTTTKALKTVTVMNNTGYNFSSWSKTSGSITAATTVTANFAANALIFANQTIIKTYSTSSQTATITGASNGTGTYTYTEKSEKNAGGTSTSYISISGTTITLAAKIPAGIYTYVITAKDSNSGATKDATYTITVDKNPSCSCTISSSTTMTYPGATSGSISYTCGGDGTINVTSNNTNVITVGTKEISSATLTAKAIGSSRITVSCAEGTNYKACTSAYKDISVAGTTYQLYLVGDGGTISGGKTLTNMVTNGSFENGSTGWFLDNASVVSTQKSTGSHSLRLGSGYAMSRQEMTVKAPTLNHKYYGRTMFFSDDSFTVNDNRFEWHYNDLAGGQFVFANKNDKTTSWVTKSNVNTLTSSTYVNNNWNIRNFVVDASTVSYVDDVIIIDLTNSYGSGNELTDLTILDKIPYFDGSTSIYNKSVTYNSPYGTLPTPERTNYKFEGWYTARNGGGTKITNTSTVSTGSNQLLYPKWELNILPGSISYGTKSLTKTYGDAAFTNALTKVGDGAVTYSSSNTNVATVNSDGVVTIVGAGTTTITATVADSSNYTYATKTATYTLTVNQAKTATTGGCLTPTYNGSAQTLASGGSHVTYTNNSQTNVKTDGNYTVTVTTDGNHQFSDGTESKTLSCNIGQRSVTITAGSTSKTYDGTALTSSSCTGNNLVSGQAVTCTMTSGSTITNAGSASNVINTVVIKNGSTDVTSNYNVTKANGTLTVNQAKTATTGGCLTPTYNGSAQTLASGGSHVTYTNNSQTNVKTDGNYTVTVTTDANHQFSDGTESKTLSCNIGKRNLTVTAGSTSKTYDGTALTSSSCTGNNLVSGQAVTCAMTSGSTITNSGNASNVINTVVIKSGSIDVTSNYNVTKANGTLTVNKAKTATTGSCTTPTYNGTAQTLASGGSYVTYSNNSGTNATSYTVTVTTDANHQFSDGTESKTLSCNIGKRNLTVTAGSTSKTYDGTALTSSSCTGNNLVSGQAVTCAMTSGSTITNAGKASNVINTVVIKSGSIDVTSNYNVTKANGTLTVNKAKTATTGSCATLTYNGTAQTLASGGSYVTYSNNSGTNATSYTVTVTTDGNHQFNDGTESKTLSCKINPKNSTITVSKTSLPLTYEGSVMGTFTYTYDGDGTLNCDSSNSNIKCSLSNTKDSGTATIIANAVGNATITLSATAVINYSVPTNKTLAVTVTPKEYAISYNACGGVELPSNQTKSYGETIKISNAKPTREGYVFVGWSNTSCDATVVYDANTIYEYSDNANLNLFAIWQSNVTLVEHVESLYNNLSTVINNNITYYVDATDKLINDGLGKGGVSEVTGGNIRYYDETPNNYVYFNCDIYPSTSCELWRIIGVFTVNGERKVKIIRANPIERLTFDNSLYDSSNNYIGFYEWKHSRLMMLLNPTDYASDFTSYKYNRGLYWNNADGTCYDGSIDYNNVKDKTTMCNFGTNNMGLRNDTTRNMIAESLFKVGTSALISNDDWTRAARYANQVYNQERGQGFSADEWTGKVGIPYASDYGYAADFEKCKIHLREGKQDNCDNYNWMNNNKNDFWTMSRVWYATYYFEYCDINDCPNNPYTYMNSTSTYFDHYVYPTVYLNTTVKKVGGDGSSGSPYQLSAS